MANRTATPRTRLKEEISKNGTYRVVSFELDITETHLREIASGRSVPGTKLLKRMENYFGYPDEVLFPDLNDPAFYLSTAK
jgi:transcriptional regulator with XRE-family HTH domain